MITIPLIFVWIFSVLMIVLIALCLYYVRRLHDVQQLTATLYQAIAERNERIWSLSQRLIVAEQQNMMEEEQW